MTDPVVDLMAASRRIAGQLARRQPPAVAVLPPAFVQGLKVAEEAGELARAVLGAYGANPRKGVTHGDLEMLQEAFDVALTALTFGQMVAPALFEEVVIEQLAFAEARAAASGAPAVVT